MLPANPSDDIKTLVETLYSKKDDISLQEVFISALDMEEVLRLGIQRAELDILTHLPRVIRSLVNASEEGDVKAARTLLEAIGMIGTLRSNSGANNTFVNQINLNPQDVERLIREYENYKFTEVDDDDA